MDSSFPKTVSHQPVLLKEVLTLLDLHPGEVVVDGTVGSGGHAREILKCLQPKGQLIAIDQDAEAVTRACRNLSDFSEVQIVQANFTEIPEVLNRLNIPHVDAVLLDVGISSEQLEEAGRGFSFMKEGPLDMRMNPSTGYPVKDWVNTLSEKELEEIFRCYGEERWARKIARNICRVRQEKPIETTLELAETVRKSVPRPLQFGPRHPATRVFQALRIYVNDELKALEKGLEGAFGVLAPEGRLAVISFHSLEDRIVKHTFQAWVREGKALSLTRKPVQPSEEEVEKNPRSRSAKLRAIKKSMEPPIR